MRNLIRLALSLLLVLSLTIPAYADASTETPVTDNGGTSTETPVPVTPPVTDPLPHTHAFGAGTVTTPATCTTPGVLTKSCSCGDTQTEFVPVTDHVLSGWQKVDDANHSRACTGCGGLSETAAHTWDGGVVSKAPTCSDAGVKTFTCAGCGAARTEAIEKNPNAHTFGAWNAEKQTNHVRACNDCGKTESASHSWDVTETIPATCKAEGAKGYGCSTCGRIEVEVLPKLTTHTYDHGCDTDCNVCGAVRETEHKYNTAWSRDSKEHWHACTICGQKNDVGKHYPGPAATEEKAQICLTCGLTLTPKLNHTHKYAATWTTDEAAHWYACDGCEAQKDYAEHTYDDGCDPDCNVCGYLTDTAHTYEEIWESDGTGHWTLCTTCQETSPVYPHEPGPEATQTEAQLCRECGFELAPAVEHVHEADQWISDEADHWKVCECGEIIEKAPHTWDDGTENEDTTVTYVCTECAAERIEGEPAEPSGFPWGIVVAVLVLAALGAGVALFFVLRREKEEIA